MKKLSPGLLKSLLVLLFFTSTSIVLYTKGVRTVNEVQANVTEAQVVEYLEEYGYEVKFCSPKPNTISDWMAHTVINGENRLTIVHVSGDNIVGYEDVSDNNVVGHDAMPN